MARLPHKLITNAILQTINILSYTGLYENYKFTRVYPVTFQD